MQANNAMFKQITNLQRSLTILRFHHWLHFELFKLQWWLLAAALVIPWIVWTGIVDKRRLKDLFLYGLVAAFVITMLDAIGCDLGLWAYMYKALPLYNRCIAIDVGIRPVIFMMVYQYCRKWKTFATVHIILAAIFAFVMEPLAQLSAFVFITIGNTFTHSQFYRNAYLSQIRFRETTAVRSSVRSQILMQRILHKYGLFLYS